MASVRLCDVTAATVADNGSLVCIQDDDGSTLLNRRGVELLLAALTRWLETGSVAETTKERGDA